MASIAPDPSVLISGETASTTVRGPAACTAHDHVCLIYEDQEEQLAAVVPFLTTGLERGEKCLYVADENTADFLTNALRAEGIDVDAMLASGAFAVITTSEAYLKNGDFDPEAMLGFLESAVMEAEAAGFSAFRVVAEMTWALAGSRDVLRQLIDYECRINEFFPKHNMLAICQYDRRRFRPETLLQVIHTHPLLIHGGLWCDNQYFIPPDVFEKKKFDAAAEVQRLLDGITQNGQLRQDLAAEAEQANRLSVEAARWRQLYEAVLANTPDLGCIFDLDHRFTFANGALLRIWGKTWDEAIGKTCLELGYEPWHAAMHDREIEEVIATRKPIRGEVPFSGANGRRIYDYIFFPVIGPTGEVVAVGGTTRDITERKQAEEALRESEQRFRTIVDTTPECVKLVAADGTLLHMNPPGLGMIGAESLDAVVGKSAYELIAPEHRDEYRSFNERICRGEKGSLQFDIVSLQGARRHMEAHAAPFRQPDGETVQLSLTRDITERRKTEQALRESEQRLAAELADMQELHKISSEIGYDEETEGLYEKIVDAAVTIMGSDFASMQMLYPERGVAGELLLLAQRGFDPEAAKFWEWVRADSNCSCGAALRTRKQVVVADTEQCESMAGTADLEAYRAAGMRAMQTTPLVSRSGRLLGMITTHWREPHQPSERDLRTIDILARQAADLLDRKLAFRETRESEQRLAAFVNATSDVVYQMSPDWSQMRRLLGKEFIAETTAPDEAWLGKYIHPDDQQSVLARIHEAIRTKTIFEMEHRVLRADGSLGWTISRAVPVFTPDGEIREWFGAATDITDLKLATERHRQSEAALRKSEKFAAAGRMAATIAHEINNPLEAIMNLSYLLGQENLSGTGKELVRALDSELNRVSHIAKQTLAFYRDGKTAGPLDLAEPINDAVVLFARKAELRGARVETQFRTSASLFGFSGELRQVFANLISNALESGASTIKIRVSPGREADNGNRAGVRVVVADNGSGIPADSFGKLFEPFFTTKEEKGTGLGLWVSKGIVQKHEGWIRARTSTRPEHNGTTFCLFLPILKEDVSVSHQAG